MPGERRDAGSFEKDKFGYQELTFADCGEEGRVGCSNGGKVKECECFVLFCVDGCIGGNGISQGARDDTFERGGCQFS